MSPPVEMFANVRARAAKPWCGDPHHDPVVPHADGERAVLVPILGEAA